MDVQGRLVEVLSGQKLDVYLAEHIFKPLGMTSTRYVVKPWDADVLKLAPTYQRQQNGTCTASRHRRPRLQPGRLAAQGRQLGPGLHH